jgi:hypothetical protein
MKIKNKFILRAYLLLLLSLFCSTIFNACGKQEVNNSVNNSITASTITQGKWRIAYFLINNQNRTAQFSGYVFTFNSDQTVNAQQGSNASANGTWQISKNSRGGEFLVINFGNQFYFQELNGDWFVNRNQNGVLGFENLIGGAGSTDYLTFERI